MSARSRSAPWFAPPPMVVTPDDWALLWSFLGDFAASPAALRRLLAFVRRAGAR